MGKGRGGFDHKFDGKIIFVLVNICMRIYITLTVKFSAKNKGVGYEKVSAKGFLLAFS